MDNKTQGPESAGPDGSPAMTDKHTDALKPCPLCGAKPHRGLGKVRHCQLHGDPIQDFSIWCPKGHVKVTAPNERIAVEEWSHRPNTPDEVKADQEPIPYVERLEYEERILAAEMQVEALKRLVPQDQEPVAWMYRYDGAKPILTFERAPYRTTWTEIPLYAAPPADRNAVLEEAEIKAVQRAIRDEMNRSGPIASSLVAKAAIRALRTTEAPAQGGE